MFSERINKLLNYVLKILWLGLSIDAQLSVVEREVTGAI